METGIYTLKRWDKETFAIVPEKLKVFGNIYEKNPEKTKILIYIDEEKINAPKEFILFLGYALETYSDFKVYLSTQLNVGLINNVDIVIEDVGLSDFIKELEKYDDGTKVFVSKNELNEIRSKNDFKSFVKMLKNWIGKKKSKREVLSLNG